MSSAPPAGSLTRANPPPPIELISGSVTLTAAAAATAASAALPPARYASAAASAAYGVPAAAAKVWPFEDSIIGYDNALITATGKAYTLVSENGGVSRRGFNTASYEEVKNAQVADSYFHRTLDVLRARSMENTPVHVE